MLDGGRPGPALGCQAIMVREPERAGGAGRETEDEDEAAPPGGPPARDRSQARRLMPSRASSIQASPSGLTRRERA